MRTQVGIVGAGPAGLFLSHLLSLQGIASVVLEAHSRAHVEQRVRAGVLEQGTVDLFERTGVGERMRSLGLVHRGIELRFRGRGHRIALSDLTGGRAITIYGQQEVVKDLISARLSAGGTILFEVDSVQLQGVDGDTPSITFNHDGQAQKLECEVVAGCDGFHGVSRGAIPSQLLTSYIRDYPFAWLGILAEVSPSADELIYCYHDRGFALLSLRSPQLSRLYIQVDPTEDIGDWSDHRIWGELHARLAAESWTLREGRVVEKGITPMRSFVVEPMQYGRLYLAGDAAHIVPPTGAKGLNLAVADVTSLAAALAGFFGSGTTAQLDGYSANCLRRVWRAQHFSGWMTSMLHRLPDQDPYQTRLQLAQLEYTVNSRAAATSLAENYVGYAWADEHLAG